MLRVIEIASLSTEQQEGQIVESLSLQHFEHIFTDIMHLSMSS